MIAKMLHLPPDKNKLLQEQDAQSAKAHTTEYLQGYDLHPCVKQHKSSRDSRGALYDIHSRWIGLNHVNVTASEAEMALQISTHDGEKKALNWEVYVA